MTGRTARPPAPSARFVSDHLGDPPFTAKDFPPGSFYSDITFSYTRFSLPDWGDICRMSATKCVIEGGPTVGLNLRASRFEECTLRDVTITSAHINYTVFSGCRIESAVFDTCRLSALQFQQCRGIRNLVFTNCWMTPNLRISLGKTRARFINCIDPQHVGLKEYREMVKHGKA